MGRTIEGDRSEAYYALVQGIPYPNLLDDLQHLETTLEDPQHRKAAEWLRLIIHHRAPKIEPFSDEVSNVPADFDQEIPAYQPELAHLAELLGHQQATTARAFALLNACLVRSGALKSGDFLATVKEYLNSCDDDLEGKANSGMHTIAIFLEQIEAELRSRRR